MDIVYAADHQFMFYACVSALSLMEHVPPEEEIRLHLLTEGGLSTEDAALWQSLTRRYRNLVFLVHDVSEPELRKRDFSDSIWSVATCYRLVLPELLPDVDTCLYLDADTMIAGDITPLFHMDLGNDYFGGVFSDTAHMRGKFSGATMVPLNTYVNAGVLLMNLALMRAHHLQDAFLKEILTDAPLVDQDILNFCCYGRIRLLPPAYNYYGTNHVDAPVIYHFAYFESIRPWRNPCAEGGTLWWSYARQFADVTDVERRREEADWYRRGSLVWILGRCADYEKVYVTGSGRIARDLFRALRMSFRGSVVQIGENELPAYSPVTLLIYASRRKQSAALSSFLEHKGAQKQVILFQERSVIDYNVLPVGSIKEALAQRIMWEHGIDARGVAIPSALLEVQAARHPNEPMVTEYTDGMRTVTTCAQVNRMANRAAAYLTGRKTKRGTEVFLKEDGTRSAGASFASLAGIWKAGCVFAAKVERSEASEKGCKEPGARTELNPSACFDVSLSERGPLADPTPEEAAVLTDGALLTGRMVIDAADDFRRRLCLYAGEAVLIADVPLAESITERISALWSGCNCVVFSGTDAKTLIEMIVQEGCTILRVSRRVLAGMLDELERRRSEGEDIRLPLCRVLLCPDASASDRDRWKQQMPHIPLNGLGYRGAFYYDTPWYV